VVVVLAVLVVMLPHLRLQELLVQGVLVLRHQLQALQ
jgi:hypothetical protein